MRWIKKMDDTFFDGHDELYHRVMFEEDRTMRAGYRCEMWCFFVTHRFRSTLRSRGAYFEQALSCRLLPDFDAVFSLFFRMDYSFRGTTQFSFSR